MSSGDLRYSSSNSWRRKPREQVSSLSAHGHASCVDDKSEDNNTVDVNDAISGTGQHANQDGESLLGHATQAETIPSNNAGRHQFSNINITGSAKVHLGNLYLSASDILESGNPEQRRNGTFSLFKPSYNLLIMLAALLNALSFDNMNAKRNQLAATIFAPQSFHWIRDTSFKDWLVRGERPYWIRGKPGSGKSTIAKFLSESSWVRDSLKTDGKDWVIIYFFFDFRFSSSIANSPVGMLRMFLKQLIESVPSIVGELSSSERGIIEQGESTTDLTDVFSAAVTRSGKAVCGFIDGLDEYEGNLTTLVSLIETVRARTGLRLCLASRPEPELVDALSEYETIIMEEHNGSSIKAYIEKSISIARTQDPDIEETFTPQVQDEIHDRAQGVILWAKFATDDLIKACNDTTSSKDLISRLNNLPNELEKMYARILLKINKRFQCEAAACLYLIMTCDGNIETFLLHGALNHILSRLSQIGTKPRSWDQVRLRCQILFGNVLDFLDDTVRLVHQTFRAYLQRSRWSEKILVAEIPQLVKSSIWTDLCFEVILKSSDEHAIDMNLLREALCHESGLSETFDLDQITNWLLWRNIVSEPWKDRAKFLTWCTAYIEAQAIDFGLLGGHWNDEFYGKISIAVKCQTMAIVVLRWQDVRLMFARIMNQEDFFPKALAVGLGVFRYCNGYRLSYVNTWADLQFLFLLVQMHLRSIRSPHWDEAQDFLELLRDRGAGFDSEHFCDLSLWPLEDNIVSLTPILGHATSLPWSNLALASCKACNVSSSPDKAMQTNALFRARRSAEKLLCLDLWLLTMQNFSISCLLLPKHVESSRYYGLYGTPRDSKKKPDDRFEERMIRRRCMEINDDKVSGTFHFVILHSLMVLHASRADDSTGKGDNAVSWLRELQSELNMQFFSSQQPPTAQAMYYLGCSEVVELTQLMDEVDVDLDIIATAFLVYARKSSLPVLESGRDTTDPIYYFFERPGHFPSSKSRAKPLATYAEPMSFQREGDETDSDDEHRSRSELAAEVLPNRIPTPSLSPSPGPHPPSGQLSREQWAYDLILGNLVFVD